MAELDWDSAKTDADVGDFFALLKPRVMSLVVFTSAVGLIVAPIPVHPVIAFTAILAIAVGAGASGALNMWYDADIDRVMSRTASRPIPAGKIDPQDALAFGLILSVFAVFTMAVLVNYAAAGLLALTIGFYVLVYTMWLKRRTPQNIVIGGAAGAFPPMIGWATATGSVSVESVLLFGLIFLWTPAHFWALALVKEGDYEAAGVPMMPNVAGPKSTRRQIVLYAVLTVGLSLGLLATPIAGLAYTLTAIVLGVGFIGLSVRVWRSDAHRPAMQLFGFSILYLFALFLSLLIDALV